MNPPMDYSTVHGMVSDLFPWPTTPEEWHSLRLSDDQVREFHETGFLTGVRILDDHQIGFLRDELTELMTPDHAGKCWWYEYHSNESAVPGQVLFHALGAWRLRPGFHDLLWSPRFVVAASQLLGGPVRFWHDQLFCKPARHGGVVAWHQDYSYWTRTVPMQHLTCWIGLDDSNEENGCVQYIPGSHRWDLLPITGLAGAMDSIRAILSDEQWRQFQNPVSAILQRGSCSFHHPLTMHGSRANQTGQPRRAVVLNVCLDGTRSASDEPLLQGVPPVPAGQELQGQFFPLLFREAQTVQPGSGRNH